jgi:hypothetical protein
MNNRSNFPIYKAVVYLNNPETGYYTKTAQQPLITPVMRLPYELKVEPTQMHEIKCNAEYIIRGKEKFKNGKSFKFFTGLQETNFQNWYSGNDYEKLKTGKKLSLCLFHFCKGRDKLTVFYFGRYYIESREARERFIRAAIPQLLQLQF